VYGNLKFDAQPDAAQLDRGRAWRAAAGMPVIMFASSREGEEAELFGVLKASQPLPPVRWLVVPRHPQRFGEVAALAAQHGFTVSRRSGWTDGPAPADIWIGDSLGEMAQYYACADAALLGGSFAPLGGQNLIEAAACGCPVIMGPHTFNFAEAAQLAQQAGAAQRVAGMEEGVRAALALVADPVRQAQAVQAAQQFTAAHQGAATRTAQAVADLLAR
jgi:3-deoxy-D-manno-octulosonic-acid transferase